MSDKFKIDENDLITNEKMSMESSLKIVESFVKGIGNRDFMISFFTKDGHQTIHYDATTHTLSEALPEKDKLFIIPEEPKPIKFIIKE